MSETTCLNLLETFGTDYRVTFDPAYDSRHVPRRCLDPWLMQLPCRGKGVCIYPHGADRLAAEGGGGAGAAGRPVAGRSAGDLRQPGGAVRPGLQGHPRPGCPHPVPEARPLDDAAALPGSGRLHLPSRG